VLFNVDKIKKFHVPLSQTSACWDQNCTFLCFCSLQTKNLSFLLFSLFELLLTTEFLREEQFQWQLSSQFFQNLLFFPSLRLSWISNSVMQNRPKIWQKC
jgi:hypothetical protein